MNYLKSALQSKTVWFGLLLAIVSWVHGLVIAAPLPPEVIGVVGSIIGGVIVWLRTQTSVPLAEKGAKHNEPNQ